MTYRRSLRLIRSGGLLLVVAAVLSLDPVFAECLPPITAPPRLTDSGYVVLQWVDPGCPPDTLRWSDGVLRQPFHVSERLPEPRFALRITPDATKGLVRGIRAYYLAGPSVTAGQWRDSASFAWALRSDARGIPSELLYPAQLSELGVHPELLAGGWLEEDVGWWLTGAGSSGLWLTGAWAAPARKVVRIGADGRSCDQAFLVGFGDGGGSWTASTMPGLLVEAIVIPSHDTIAVACPGSPGSGIAFRVQRRSISGMFAPDGDTIAISDTGPMTWVDRSVLAGQVLRYRILSSCRTTKIPGEWSSAFTVAPLWPVEISPDRLRTTILPPEAQSPVLRATVRNHGTDELRFRLDTTRSGLWESGRPLADLSAQVLRADPAVFTIAASDSQLVVIQVDGTGLEPGSHTLAAVYNVWSTRDGRFQNWGIPVEAFVDVSTAVVEGDESDKVFARKGLTVSPVAAPFADDLVLRIRWTYGLTRGSQDASFPGREVASDGLEVLVYDILGRLKRREWFLRESLRSISGPDGVVVRISGVSDWPSGIYICHARLGRFDGSAKLVHVK